MVTDTFVREASVRTFLSMKLAGWLEKRASKPRTATAPTWVNALLTTALHLAGFSSLTIAAFIWDIRAGFVVLGLCCFVLSRLINATTNVDEMHRPNLRGR